MHFWNFSFWKSLISNSLNIFEMRTERYFEENGENMWVEKISWLFFKKLQKSGLIDCTCDQLLTWICWSQILLFKSPVTLKIKIKSLFTMTIYIDFE